MIRRDHSPFDPLFLQPELSRTILLSDLRLDPYEIKRILEVRITQEVNEHATLYCRGLLAEDIGLSYIEQNAKGKNISLIVLGHSRNEAVLYSGIIKEIEVKVIEGVYHLEVHAISYSSLLDVKQRSRSFQDKKMTYTQLLEKITAAYSGAAVIDMVSGGKPINQFLVQHLETDWGLIKRIAATDFNTGLVCDPRFDTPKYYFGIPRVQLIELDCFNYSVKKDFQKFKTLSENGVKQLTEHDFICYEVETASLLNIGDRVKFQGKQLQVAALKRMSRQELFLNQYVLMPTRGFSQPECLHQQIVGCSFGARVIAVNNDTIKVHLDIDEAQDVATASYLKYSTIYSSPDGSGWYCMPEIGDRVRVHFPDGNDDHAYAISSVHEPVVQEDGNR